jgi:hypothetical protein
LRNKNRMRSVKFKGDNFYNILPESMWIKI